MAWEERGGRLYYYRKIWKDGRCFSVYEGAGLAGKLAEERDRREREEARRVTLDAHAELAAFDEVDAMIDADWLRIQEATAEALEAAGYHRHKR